MLAQQKSVVAQQYYNMLILSFVIEAEAVQCFVVNAVDAVQPDVN